MSIMERLQQVFRDVFDDTQLTISEHTTANDVADWDSIAHIRLVIAVEQEFGIHFALGELQSLQNVGEMLTLVKEKSQ